MLEFLLLLEYSMKLSKQNKLLLYKFAELLPALIRSARVPWGVSSNKISPDRYCLSNSAFSPTYEAITWQICLCFRRRPKPKLSTPQLLETTIKLLTFDSKRPEIKFSGIPHKPNPCVEVLACYVNNISQKQWVTSNQELWTRWNIFHCFERVVIKMCFFLAAGAEGIFLKKQTRTNMLTCYSESALRSF